MVRWLLPLFGVALFLSGPEAAELPRTGSWVEARTAHFTLYSSTGSGETKTIAIELERFREALGRLAKGFDLGDETPTVFYVFRNDGQFTPYKLVVDGRPANIAGYFAQAPFRNYVAFDSSADRGMRVVYHEYLHTVLHRTFPYVPPWLDEGLAEFYSTFRFHALSNQAELGSPIAEHMQHLEMFGPMLLSELLASEAPSHDEFGRQGRFYAQAWLLVHFLATDETRRAGLNGALGMLKQGTDPDEAVASVLGPDSAFAQAQLGQYLGILQRCVKEAVSGCRIKLTFDDPIEKQSVAMRDLAPGEALYRLGDLLASLGAPMAAAARAHLEAALAQGGPAALIRAAMGTAAEAGGDLEEAARQYRLATEIAGAEAEVYARRGMFVLHRFLATSPEMDDEAETPAAVLEARTLLQKSVELDPGGVDALAALGTTYLFGAGGASEGLHALGRANALRPDRIDVLAELACMLAKSGKDDAAWTVIKSQLGPRDRDGAAVRQAEQCIVMVQWDTANELLTRGDTAAASAILSELERRVTGEELRSQVRSFRRELEHFETASALALDSMPPEEKSRIVGEYNRAVGLLEAGKLEDGLAALEHTIEGCPAGEFCARLRSTADSVRRTADHNRIVERLNEAVALLNAGKSDQAIAALRALQAEVTQPELAQKIRELLDELGAR